MEQPTQTAKANPISALKIALRFLTRLPVHLTDEEDTVENRQLSTVFYPTVGLIIALILWALSWIFYHAGLIYFAGGCLLLAVWVGLTGGLHLDGFMDVIDAFLYPGTKEKRLEIMKDVHHGTFATVALVLLLIAKYMFAQQALPMFPLFQPQYLFAPILARFIALRLVQSQPVINPNGMAAALKKELHPKAVRINGIIILVLFLAIEIFMFYHKTHFMGFAKREIASRVFLVGAFFLRGVVYWKLPDWIGAWAKRAIGGINGDVLGFAIEITEVAVLFLAELQFMYG